MKMTLRPKSLAQLPFSYRVDCNRTYENEITPTLAEVEEWAVEIDLDCVISTNSAYFKTEQDAMFFILRWA